MKKKNPQSAETCVLCYSSCKLRGWVRAWTHVPMLREYILLYMQSTSRNIRIWTKMVFYNWKIGGYRRSMRKVFLLWKFEFWTTWNEVTKKKKKTKPNRMLWFSGCIIQVPGWLPQKHLGNIKPMLAGISFRFYFSGSRVGFRLLIKLSEL